MSDRFNVNTSLSRNWEHVNTKFVGTGHPDISRQDTHSTLLGHSDMLLFASAAEGVTSARMRFQLLERMVAPVGAPPALSPAALLTKKVLAVVAAKSGSGEASGGGSSSSMADR